MTKKVQLVLGSGGARGIAHMAVIDELEKRGYEIIEVVGCSMGAIVGGMYAAGHHEKYKQWMFSLNRSDVLDLLDFTFTKTGFLKGEKVFEKHIELIGDVNIEDFGIPFTAVATEMKTNNEVHFRSGKLFKALRASVSIPGVFTPVVQDGNVLVDGGVLNPVPVDLVLKREDALIVAVDLNGKPTREAVIRYEEKEEPKWYEQLLPDTMLEKSTKEKEEDSFSLVELMDNTFSYTQDRLKDLMLDKYKPDILVQLPRNLCSTFDFFKAKEIYEAGSKAFDKAMGSTQN